MAIAGLLLAIYKRVMTIADLLRSKTRRGEPITSYVATPAVNDVFVAVLNARITKREACITCPGVIRWVFCSGNPSDDLEKTLLHLITINIIHFSPYFFTKRDKRDKRDIG